MIMFDKNRFIRICYLIDLLRKSMSFDFDETANLYVDYTKTLAFVRILEKQLKEEVRGVRDDKKQKNK